MQEAVEGPTQKFDKIPGKVINAKFLYEKIFKAKEALQGLKLRPDPVAKNSGNVNLEVLRYSRDVDRIYLCGPPKFLSKTSNDLERLGFPKGRIYFV